MIIFLIINLKQCNVTLEKYDITAEFERLDRTGRYLTFYVETFWDGALGGGLQYFGVDSKPRKSEFLGDSVELLNMILMQLGYVNQKLKYQNTPPQLTNMAEISLVKKSL